MNEKLTTGEALKLAYALEAHDCARCCFRLEHAAWVIRQLVAELRAKPDELSPPRQDSDFRREIHETESPTITTLESVRAEVERIRGAAGDDEIAHGLEDALHQNVLALIATGHCPDPPAFASAALETLGVEFSRWYA